MKLLTSFTALLLVGLAYTAPTSNKKTVHIWDENFFARTLLPFTVYTAEHDIVSILVQYTNNVMVNNDLNFAKDSDTEEKSDSDTIAFIVEADFNDKGERVDQGLYMLKGRHATKLLDNGRDAAATNDDTKTAYFAAKDGIYIYNAEEIKADKYGSVNDSLISIAKVNGSDVLYVLTEDHVLYKVTKEGTKKEKIDTVVNAKQIVLDNQNILYYCTTDNQVYALGSDGVTKIKGLPQNPTLVNIMRPLFADEAGVLVLCDGKVRYVHESGYSDWANIEFTVKPVVYDMEAMLIQYIAYNKKVYEINGLDTIRRGVLQIKDYYPEHIQSIIAAKFRGARVNKIK